MDKKKRNTLIREIWRRLKKNKLAVISLVILAITFLLAISAPLLFPGGYAEQDLSQKMQAPSLKHWFGTDNFGRDLLTRIVYGSRYTLIIGFGCGTASLLIGIFFGVLAGTNKRFDMMMMRVIDVIMGIPTFTLSLALVVAMGKSIVSIMVALAVTNIPFFARIVRVQVLTVYDQEYIEAAVSVGASKLWIIVKHVLPNSLAPIIVQYTYQVVSIIMGGAGLSFIGMGIQVPKPEWGLMISQGRAFLRDQWHLAIIPGIAIIIVTYALNLLGDGMRDALDPRLKQ